jgi:hypothetical protein
MREPRILPRPRRLLSETTAAVTNEEDEASPLSLALRHTLDNARALESWLRGLPRWQAPAARVALVRQLGAQRAATVWEAAHVPV